VADQITTEQVLAEYKRITTTFDKMGLRPLFAANIPMLALLPAKLTGKPLATCLRNIAAGLMKQADAEEAKVAQAMTAEAEDGAAEF